ETRWITRWPECVIPQTHANERRRRSGHRIGSTQLELNCRHVHYIPSSFDSLDAELKCAVAYGITRGHSICKKPRSSGWDRTRDWERNRIYCDLACGWNLISERLHLRVRRREYKSAGKNCRIRWLYNEHGAFVSKTWILNLNESSQVEFIGSCARGRRYRRRLRHQWRVDVRRKTTQRYVES